MKMAAAHTVTSRAILGRPLRHQAHRSAPHAASAVRASVQPRCLSNSFSGSSFSRQEKTTGMRNVSLAAQAIDVDVEQLADLKKTASELQTAMLEAVAVENYAEAARLRDELKHVEAQDPVKTAQELLQQAVDEERYEDAAELRDTLSQLVPPEPEAPAVERVPCASDTITEGMRVKVRSFYVRDRSMPEMAQYFFAYRISIRNEGTRTLQLRNRHWVITNGSGEVEEVRGPGVVGEQPVLRPGSEFEYTSACPLHTPFGSMQGSYEMVVVEEDGTFGEVVEVKIGQFGLDADGGDIAEMGP